VKKPNEKDFDVEINEGYVEVIFRPTKSHYSFAVLADRRGLSQSPDVRHAKTGDTGEYMESEVRDMAFRLASRAISSG
jgi:hypothetical protein